jgi:hypothetical protein
MKKSTICRLPLLFIPVFIITGLAEVSISQDTPSTIVAISAGGGMLTFYGDIGKGKGVTPYRYTPGGFVLNVEKPFMNNMVGASLNVMSGKLAAGERSKDTARNKNFESSLMQVGLNLTFYMQNKKSIPFIPYFTTGFSYAMLSAKTDLKYAGDSLYHYWDDGSIYNLPQTKANASIAHQVKRDYKYETPLASAAKSAMGIPIGIGVKVKIAKKIDINIGATYHLSLTKGIDGVKGGGMDGYLFSYCSLTYKLLKKSKDDKNKETSNVDFSSIDKLDADGDGVNDNNDECPGTPKGVKVNSKGCPLDSDGDGVPDYLDKTPRKGYWLIRMGKLLQMR